MDRFCLALFSQKDASGGDTSLAPAIAGLIFDEQEKFHLVPVSTGQVFVLFSFVDRSEPERYIKKIHHDLQQFQKSPVSVGYCTYPDGNGSRTESIRRCYKALMHGDFYGEGSVVHFDHLSLNVSGDWYFEQGDFRQAVREYSQGLKRMPGEKNLLNSLGVALIEMKRISQAITAFHEVLGQDPDNHMALVNLGYAFLQKGQRGKAQSFFEKAYAVQYHAGLEGVDALRQLSRLYIFSGRFQDALVALGRWQEAGYTEQDFLFHQLLGRAHFETGSAGPAMKALQKALRLHPKDAESMSLLGLLYISENEGEEAGRVLLEKALSLDGSRAVYWYRYGAALLHLARYDEALAAVRKSRRLKKTDIDAGLLLVEILLRQQKMKLARRHLDRLQARNGMSAGQKQRAAKLFSEFFDKSKKET
jgi:tetratricopeptide (TPR) repeat protein